MSGGFDATQPSVMESTLETSALVPARYKPPLELMADPPRDEISLAEVSAVIRKRRWVVISCLGLALALAAAYCILAPRRYEASVRVVVNPESGNPLGLEVGAAMNPFLDPALMQETQVHIMQSDTVAWDVIRKLRLDKTKEFASKKYPELADSVDNIGPDRRFELLNLFHRRLNVASVPKTALVELRFRSKDPKLAVQIVNATADAYLERNFRAHYNANMQVSEWLTKQLDDLKKKVTSSQQEVVDFQKQNGIIGTDETHNIVLSQLDEMNKQLAGAQAERIVREARYRQALSDDPEVIAQIAPSTKLQLLQGQQADLKNQYAQLTASLEQAIRESSRCAPNWPRLNRHYKRSWANTRQGLQAQYEAASKGKSWLQEKSRK